MTGTLIIDFHGQSDSNVIFQIGSTLTTASGSNIVVVNGNATDGVFFQVGSSATLGTTTTFAGNILASDSITLNTGAKILCGRAIALNAAVTMDTNTILTIARSVATSPPGGPISAASASVAPSGAVFPNRDR